MLTDKVAIFGIEGSGVACGIGVKVATILIKKKWILQLKMTEKMMENNICLHLSIFNFIIYSAAAEASCQTEKLWVVFFLIAL